MKLWLLQHATRHDVKDVVLVKYFVGDYQSNFTQ